MEIKLTMSEMKIHFTKTGNSVSLQCTVVKNFPSFFLFGSWNNNKAITGTQIHTKFTTAFAMYKVYPSGDALCYTSMYLCTEPFA